MQVQELQGNFGQVGDAQLFLMAGLMIADELWDTRAKLAAAQSRAESVVSASAQSVHRSNKTGQVYGVSGQTKDGTGETRETVL